MSKTLRNLEIGSVRDGGSLLDYLDGAFAYLKDGIEVKGYTCQDRESRVSNRRANAHCGMQGPRESILSFCNP